MSALRKLKPQGDERPERPVARRPESALRKRSPSVGIPSEAESRSSSRTALTMSMGATSPPGQRPLSPLPRGSPSPTRQARAPSPGPFAPAHRAPSPSPSPVPRGRGTTPLRREEPFAPDRLTTQLMEVEERFNREMEQSRRRDLEKKHALRERQLDARVRALEALLATSNEKAAVLVRLMNERERQLEEHFADQLDRARRGQKAVRMEDDRHELLQLRALVKNLRLENDRLQEAAAGAGSGSATSQGKGGAGKPPLFGVEIEDRVAEDPGVRVVTVSGPAAAAGIQPNDVIQQLTLTFPVRSRLDFHHAAGKVEVGDRVNFVLARANGEREVIPVIAGGAGRPALRGLENLSYGGGGGSVTDSVTRSLSGRDEGFAPYGAPSVPRGSLRRSGSIEVPELRSYYKPAPERPYVVGAAAAAAAAPERVKHVALDGTVTYVPMNELLHTPAPATGPGLRSPYLTGPRAPSPLRDSPVQRYLPLTPEKGPFRMAHAPDHRLYMETPEEVTCE